MVGKNLQRFLLMALVIFGLGQPVYAQDSICARVKIEIHQELTLERQAFEARMQITNEFTDMSIENLLVEVTFADEDGNPVKASSDPDDLSALFFIRLDGQTSVDAIDGSGTISPETSAGLTWLIVPARGAAGNTSDGVLYFVGANLFYQMGGRDYDISVSPDYIYVKPLPDLTLDYFLPEWVYGDDAFTDEIEPSVPFSLGVRVSNSGGGTVHNLKIQSAQSQIVENEQGLIIDFTIEGSEVDGKDGGDSLLVQFNDIVPGTAGTARWIMHCSLSGQFVEFTADYTHADELGGELTSLISAVNTHYSIHDILVDLAGRDRIHDFLVKTDTGYIAFESDLVDTPVVDQSNSSTLAYEAANAHESWHTLSAPITTGFMYVKLPDPYGGTKKILQAVRSDGKIISSANIWLSRERDDNNNWLYFVNLFDANGTDTYRIVFAAPADIPDAPLLQHIPDYSGMTGSPLGFIVTASDPDGTIPEISVRPLPRMAHFIDREDGTGAFSWTPAKDQAGVYELVFSASDGGLSTSKTMKVTILDSTDTDGDGMADAWEMTHFGNLDRDGTGDFDKDGITDLDEFLNQTDPAENAPPLIPSQPEPENGAVNVSVVPELSWTGGDPDPDDPLTYELFLGPDPENLVLIATLEGLESFVLETALTYEAHHVWQVIAKDNKGAVTPGPLWWFKTFTADGDEDGDGLSNTREISLGTDPFDQDSDLDGYEDGEEYYFGTDPTDSTSHPPYPPRFGDLDLDGDIDGKDLYLMISTLNLAQGDPGFILRADINADGIIDLSDVEGFLHVLGYFWDEPCDPQADLDGNGAVDGNDIYYFSSKVGLVETDQGFDSRVDFNDDGRINRWDFPIFAVHLGCIFDAAP